jgi:hypothetical protein
VGQAKRFSKEISNGVKKSGDILQQIALERLREELDTRQSWGVCRAW